jgi:hypothetical protein
MGEHEMSDGGLLDDGPDDDASSVRKKCNLCCYFVLISSRGETC